MSAFKFAVGCRRDRPGAFNDIEDENAEFPESKVALIDCDNPRHKEIEALFCAAPELLAACRITANCSPVQAVLDALPDDVEIKLTFCAADLKQIRAALAKARGE